MGVPQGYTGVGSCVSRSLRRACPVEGTDQLGQVVGMGRGSPGSRISFAVEGNERELSADVGADRGNLINTHWE